MDKLMQELNKIFDNKAYYYDSREDLLRGYYNNEFSCINGCINDLIYYYQTLDIYKNHSIAILEYLSNNEYEVIIDDTLSIENHINNLVWVTFDIFTANKIAELENIQELYYE